jgi:hypothetical protein
VASWSTRWLVGSGIAPWQLGEALRPSWVRTRPTGWRALRTSTASISNLTTSSDIAVVF